MRFNSAAGWKAAVLVAALALVPGAASAQDAKLGKEIWIGKAPCRNCHGWSGNGQPDDPQAPQGLSLRATSLTGAQIVEVILCGRPASEMPYFDRNAYTDKRCYGLTQADLAGVTIGQASVTLTAREANALGAFIVEEMKGKGPPTFEECQGFWGGNAGRCNEYKKAGP